MKNPARRRLKLVDRYLSGRTTNRSSPGPRRRCRGDFDCSVGLLPVLAVPLSHTTPFLIGVHLRRARLAGWSAASLVLIGCRNGRSFTNCAGAICRCPILRPRPMTGATGMAGQHTGIMVSYPQGLLRQLSSATTPKSWHGALESRRLRKPGAGVVTSLPAAFLSGNLTMKSGPGPVGLCKIRYTTIRELAYGAG